ncbi:sensor histidine kinase [Roseateles chitinivorans]|uniref:sensor histidine kinase n=1 Tax=Roseateles chitinivorans TaxID=2917965 RepID=UPI003D66FF39
MNLTPHRPSSPSSPPAARPRVSGPTSRLTREHRIERLTRLQMTLAEAHADAEQRERERVAQLLHDQVGGLIVRLRLAFGEWRHGLPEPVAADPGLAQVTALLGELSRSVRTLTFALAPPDWHGDLQAALEALAAELALTGPLAVEVDGSAMAQPGIAEIPAVQRTVACRVVRELCLNVQKHACATRVEIVPKVEAGWLSVRVRDDGRGFPAGPLEVDARGLGLGGARAAAGAGRRAGAALRAGSRHLRDLADPARSRRRPQRVRVIRRVRRRIRLRVRFRPSPRPHSNPGRFPCPSASSWRTTTNSCAKACARS